MKAISVRIARKKTASQARGQRRHDMREGPQPAYVDPARRDLNSVIQEPRPVHAVRKICEERRQAAGAKRAMRTDAVAVIAGIVTFGTEAQPLVDALSRDEQDRLFAETAEALADKLGTSLEGLVVHRDESATHAHFTLAAVGHDGRPLSKSTGGAMLSSLQDVAAQPWAHLGITRGKPKAQRQAQGEPTSAWVHRSVSQLHADLPAEIAAAQARAEKYQALADKAREKLENTEKDEQKAQKRLEIYERRYAEAQAEISALGDVAQKIGVGLEGVDLEGWRERLSNPSTSNRPAHPKRP